jgi:hypothetical protein
VIECGVDDAVRSARRVTQAVQVFSRTTTSIRRGGLRGAHKPADLVARGDEFVNDADPVNLAAPVAKTRIPAPI